MSQEVSKLRNIYFDWVNLSRGTPGGKNIPLTLIDRESRGSLRRKNSIQSIRRETSFLQRFLRSLQA